jgi:hypothetical protein
MSTLESLPVELVAEILSHLDLRSLIIASYLSKSLYKIASDPSLNPWRKPILCNLRSSVYELSLKHLCVRTIVPRQNWIEILSLASASFILFEATLPNLTSSEWEECFARRFLPGWRKWKKDSTWKEAFLRILFRIWHRSATSCTSDEAWTSYIVLNRNGTANEVEGSSRHFNPSVIFDELKAQSDLVHLETRVRVVVELADVRILAFGTLSKRTPLSYNANAHAFLHPPGIEQRRRPLTMSHQVRDHGVYPMGTSSECTNYDDGSNTYAHMRHPVPASSFINYPFFTPGGCDRRWSGFGETEEVGLKWVGKMIVAQVIGLSHNSAGEGRQQYASFTWSDLSAITPWVDERITKKIQGIGLGL